MRPDTDLPLVWPIVDLDVATAAAARIDEAVLEMVGGIAFGRDRNDGFGAGLLTLGATIFALGATDRAEAALRELIVAGPFDCIVEGFFVGSVIAGFGCP